MRVCINTQTPPLRFRLDLADLTKKYGRLPDPLDIRNLKLGVDYDLSPGGVTAMVIPLLSTMSKSGFARESVWVCLGVKYPPRVKLGDITVSHVELDEKHLKDYGSFKEAFWSVIHGQGGRPFKKSDYLGYVRYNWVNTEKLFHYVGDADVFYVHDFQLIQTGQLIGISAPAVLRWHVPFHPENLRPLGGFVRRAIEGFDAVVVSTKRDLEGLVKLGYHGHAYQLYPYVDENQWGAPTRSAKDSLRERVRLERDERLLLLVARMDPMKSQDVAIRALARLKRRVKAKLLLIGNGSFSSSRAGGLGRVKGGGWKEHLIGTARDLGVEDRVVFMGYATAKEIKAAYALSSAVLLPSAIEGFGITALEGWINRKPVVVSRGAGVSELVVEGSNGFTFEPGRDEELSDRILKTLAPGADRLGENGAETVKRCYLSRASKSVEAVLQDTVTEFGAARSVA